MLVLNSYKSLEDPFRQEELRDNEEIRVNIPLEIYTVRSTIIAKNL